MPVGEIAGELFGGLIKGIGRILVEILFEILIKGTGYAVCRVFTRGVDPDGILVVLVGLIVWAAFGYGGYFVFANYLLAPS